MFIQKTQPEATSLDKAIEEVFSEMQGFSSDDDEYAKMVDQLVKLYSLKEKNSPEKVDANTKAIIFGNLAGILLIVGHEKTNVVTSKALSFVMKLR